MKILNKLNAISMDLLTFAGFLAIASAVINIVTALTMFAADKLDETDREA